MLDDTTTHDYALAQRIVQLAQQELDAAVREIGGPNCGPPSARYMRGLREVPWCAYFVVQMLEWAG